MYIAEPQWIVVCCLSFIVYRGASRFSFIVYRVDVKQGC